MLRQPFLLEPFYKIDDADVDSHVHDKKVLNSKLFEKNVFPSCHLVFFVQ